MHNICAFRFNYWFSIITACLYLQDNDTSKAGNGVSTNGDVSIIKTYSEVALITYCLKDKLG